MNKQIAIIGLGIFGSEVALSLINKNFSVLAIDNNPELIEEFKNRVTSTLLMDTTQKRALQEANLEEMDTVIVAIGNEHLESSILTTALLKELGVKNIIARATNELHERILRQVGATEVINPEREIGEKVADMIARPGFTSIYALEDGVMIAEIPMPALLVGKTLEEVNVRRRYGLNVLGVQRKRNDAEINIDGTVSRKTIMNLDPTTFTFEADDILLIMGHQEGIDRLEKVH